MGPYPDGATTSQAQMTWDWCNALIDAVPPGEPRNGFEATVQSARRLTAVVPLVLIVAVVVVAVGLVSALSLPCCRPTSRPRRSRST
jgi:hypothetical protein